MPTECARVDPAHFVMPAGFRGSYDQYIRQLAEGLNNPVDLVQVHARLADVQCLLRAAELLRAGEPVAIPTETVYGLAANALAADAVSRVYTAKGRPSDNPLIVHVSSMEMLERLYPGTPEFLAPLYEPIVQKYWPGPLTILLPGSPLIAPNVSCGHATIAIRMPSHPVARALISLCGFPLAAPSANSSGKPSPTLASHVVQDMAGAIPLVIDGGPCTCGVESTVLDGLRSPPAILRPGGVTFEELTLLPGMERLQVFRKDFQDVNLEHFPTTPGMKYQHYSPNARVILINANGLDACGLEDRKQLISSAARDEAAKLIVSGCTRVGLLRTTMDNGLPGWQRQEEGCLWVYNLGNMTSPAGVAHELFKALRAVDEIGLSAVVVEGVSDSHEGLAVMNRLSKAASSVISPT